MSVRYLSNTFRSITANLRGSISPNVCCQQFCTSVSSTFNPGESHGLDEKVQKKKTAIIPKITLIQDSQLSVVTLLEAQKISKRRNLKLVKIIDLDTKTQRPIYRLMTGAEYHDEDLKQRAQKKEEKQNAIKGEKVLIINHGIFEHDLQTRLKKINKWVNKLYEVRIVINGDSNNMEKAESIYNSVEASLDKDVKILQKRQKGSDIKFQISPPKRDKDDNL